MTDDDPVPPIQQGPPYSLDFVAHLHGRCYGDNVTPHLLTAVKADAEGRAMFDALETVHLDIRRLGRLESAQLP